MIGTKIKIKNHINGKEITINDHSDRENVIALQAFPTFETDIRHLSFPRQESHGEIYTGSYYSGMSMVFQGVIVGENESKVWEQKRLLDEVLELPTFEPDREPPKELVSINECNNPNGSVGVYNWQEVDSDISLNSSGGFNVETETDEDSGVFHIAELTDQENTDRFIGCEITNPESTEKTFKIVARSYFAFHDFVEGTEATEQNSIHEIITLQGGETREIGLCLEKFGRLPTVLVKVEITRVGDSKAEIGDIFKFGKVIIAKKIEGENEYFDGDTKDEMYNSYEWAGIKGISKSEMYRQPIGRLFKNTVRVSFTNPMGKKVFIDATPIKDTSYNRPMKQSFRLDFQFILRSNIPFYIVDSDRPEFYVGEYGLRKTGFKLTTKLPFKTEEFTTGAVLINSEEGGVAVIKMYGSDQGTIFNPKVTNITNGSYVSIRKTLTGSQNCFIIDGIRETMTDNYGTSVVQFSEGDYIYLEKGDNILIYTTDR